MLETPSIDEVIKLRELDLRKAALKRALRQVGGATRNFKGELQRRMHAVPDTGEMKQEERQAMDWMSPIWKMGCWKKSSWRVRAEN